MLASLAVITVLSIALDAWLKSHGIVTDVMASLYQGSSASMGLYLIPMALVCFVVAWVVAGGWSLSFGVAVLAASAVAVANSSLWVLVIGGLLLGTGTVRSSVRELREDHGINRFWAIALLSATLVPVYFGVSATVPMAKISWAIAGVTAIVIFGIFEHLFALEKQTLPVPEVLTVIDAETSPEPKTE
jgi:hypothetical protein